MSQHTADHARGRMSGNVGCGVSMGTARITDIDFNDNALTIARTLKSLSEKAEPLGNRVTSIKIKVQAFWIRAI